MKNIPNLSIPIQVFVLNQAPRKVSLPPRSSYKKWLSIHLAINPGRPRFIVQNCYLKTVVVPQLSCILPVSRGNQKCYRQVLPSSHMNYMALSIQKVPRRDVLIPFYSRHIVISLIPLIPVKGKSIPPPFRAGLRSESASSPIAQDSSPKPPAPHIHLKDSVN